MNKTARKMGNIACCALNKGSLNTMQTSQTKLPPERKISFKKQYMNYQNTFKRSGNLAATETEAT